MCPVHMFATREEAPWRPMPKGSSRTRAGTRDTIEEVGEGKVSHASVQQSFTGDITGDSNVDWHMYYAPDGTASFVGLQRIDGADRRSQRHARRAVDGGVRRQGSRGRLGRRRRDRRSRRAERHRRVLGADGIRRASTNSTTTSDGTPSAAALDRTGNVFGAVCARRRRSRLRRGRDVDRPVRVGGRRAVGTALPHRATEHRHAAPRPRADVVGCGPPRRPAGGIRAMSSAGRGRRARTTFVVLTPAGRRAASQVAAARGRGVATPRSRCSRRPSGARSTRSLAKVAVGMIREPGAVRWTCRLCDTDACGRYAGGCPIGNAAAERYA